MESDTSLTTTAKDGAPRGRIKMDVIKAYNDRTEMALTLVAKINLLILQKQREARKEGINYAHVCDMGRIVGDLTNMLDYLE